MHANDDTTLVVELEHPAAYLPELLTQPVAYPLPRAVVQAKGNAWARPENYVANGAYVLQAWIPNDRVTLVKNPLFYDAAHVRIDRVNYYPTVDGNAAHQDDARGRARHAEPVSGGADQLDPRQHARRAADGAVSRGQLHQLQLPPSSRSTTSACARRSISPTTARR